MRSKKGSHRIVVRDVEYRWRAKGDDGFVAVGIWPANNVGPYIQGGFGDHETWIDSRDGSMCSAGNQIVVTNRIIKRVIEHALTIHAYNPNVSGGELNLKLDGVIDISDAVRAARSQTTH